MNQSNLKILVDGIKAIFGSRGGRTVFVELYADLETRFARNAHPDRLVAKASKRDVVVSNRRLVDVDRRYRLNSGGDFPFPSGERGGRRGRNVPPSGWGARCATDALSQARTSIGLVRLGPPAAPAPS